MDFAANSSPEADGGSARWRWMICWALILFGWLQLAYDTRDIRESNLDDVQYHRVALEGRRLEYMQAWGPAQGRPTAYISGAPFWALDAITNPWLHQTVRLGLVALTLILLGRLVTRITGSPELTPLWLLIWIAVLQIPPTFYGLLSYPAFHCGLIFTTLALLRFWSALTQSTTPAISWSAGLLYFFALFFTESLLAFALAFALLLAWRFPFAQLRESWRPLIPILTACAIYLGIVLAYRAMHPPTYDGTQAGRSLPDALVYVARYGASSLPGFELLADRDPQKPLIVPLPELARRLATFDLWRIPWILATGVATTWLLYSAQWTLSLRRSLWLAGGFMLTGLAFLSLPGISAKYQVYAYRRSYPHVYNFTFVHFLWLALAVLGLVLVTRLSVGQARRRLCAAAVGVMVAAACLASQVSNPLALQQIRQIVSSAP